MKQRPINYMLLPIDASWRNIKLQLKFDSHHHLTFGAGAKINVLVFNHVASEGMKEILL